MIERTVLNNAGLSAQELYEFLGKFTQEEREENQIFLRTDIEGRGPNVKVIEEAIESTYGFFGVSVPCIILHTDQFATKEDEDEDCEEE